MVYTTKQFGFVIVFYHFKSTEKKDSSWSSSTNLDPKTIAQSFFPPIRVFEIRTNSIDFTWGRFNGVQSQNANNFFPLMTRHEEKFPKEIKPMCLFITLTTARSYLLERNLQVGARTHQSGLFQLPFIWFLLTLTCQATLLHTLCCSLRAHLPKARWYLFNAQKNLLT